VLYELITRQIPFQGTNQNCLSTEIIDGSREPDCSRIPVIQQNTENSNIEEYNLLNSLIEWMTKCSNRSPRSRPNMPEGIAILIMVLSLKSFMVNYSLVVN